MVLFIISYSIYFSKNLSFSKKLMIVSKDTVHMHTFTHKVSENDKNSFVLNFDHILKINLLLRVLPVLLKSKPPLYVTQEAP